MTVRAAGADFTEHNVFGHRLLVGRLPEEMASASKEQFEELWALRPEHFHEITQPFTGKSIPLPRWQQAYGRDYRYTGSVNVALTVPPVLAPFLTWTVEMIDARLNGLLLNWYDAAQNHYIGKHRDSRVGLVDSSPIVTISLGERRTFRVRPVKQKGFVDFDAAHGTVFVMPWETNLNTMHEVPKEKRARGRRISITARAFEE